MDALPARDISLSRRKTQKRLERREYAIGIVLLLIVVLLWTLSNFVTQDLYETGYNKPFLVTYMNTSAFSFYLIPLFLRRWWKGKYGSLPSVDQRSSNEYQPIALDDETTEHSLTRRHSAPEDPLAPLTDRQTANLAVAFCLLWFIANWTVNASLGYTSVASATVLSSMSGFFTLGIGRVFGVERMTAVKVVAVCTSFLGVLLVSLSDSSPIVPADPSPPGVHIIDVNSWAIWGDFLALASALFYALYVILLKVRIKAESRVDMQLFFGFVGLCNVVACWPIGVILHLTGGEVFELPPSQKAWSAILLNMVITLSSDYLYVVAMLKTTPLVVTIGLSLTIPVAVIGDFLRLRPTKGEVIVGALLVLLSFIGIGLDDSREEKEYQPRITEDI